MIRRIAWLAAVAVFAATAGGCGAEPLRLPEAWPADVPVPDQAVLRSARDQGGKGITLVFETAGAPAAVSDRLRSRLQAQEWVPLTEALLENAVFTSFRKSGRSVALGVSRTGEVTVVGVSYREAVPSGEGDQG
jgi:ABC-type uncharacterized transport system auxiliary subunit